MAVKIRLMRMGKKKQPTYRVVVADGRVSRDSRYIEAIGRYDPRQEPSMVEIDNEKALAWLSKGAQPTEPVRKLLEISGAIARQKVARGEIHTVGVVEEPAAEEAVAEEVAAEPTAGDDAAAEEAEGESPEEEDGSEDG